ncbi:MAG TPA: hypothetical protein VIY28_05825 [Pseudonocardiaceae bacterium]
MANHEPLTDVACTDPEMSEELRDALALLRDRSDNDEFRSLIDDVLAGRRSLTEASGTAAFGDVVFARVAQEFDEYLGHLSEDEKKGPATQAEPSGATDSCDTPCASCPGLCALARGDGSGASAISHPITG